MPIFGECFKAFEFCLPTNATNFPAGPEWLHEIKHDGFCLRVERDGESGAADHAWRLRLDEALSLDRRVRSEEPHQAICARRRGGSMCWRWTATICTGFHSPYERPIWPAVGPRGSSSIPLSRARSG